MGTEHPGELEQLILFAVLRLESEAYGVAIRELIRARTGRDVSAGGIYTVLQRLETRGYVDSAMEAGAPGRGGRPRKFYSLTAAGAAVLRGAHEAHLTMAAGLDQALDALAERG